MSDENERATGLLAAGWTGPQVDELLKAEDEAAEEQDRLESVQAAREAAATAPAAVIAAAKEATAAKRRARELAEEEQRGDEAFTKACAEYGGPDRVGRRATLDGPIIFRAMGLAEVDAALAMAESVPSSVDKTKIHRDAFAATVLFPSREKFNARVAKYPGLWGTLYEDREVLISGVRAEAAKKG